MNRDSESPKHGTTSRRPESESQADGTAAGAPRGETQAKDKQQNQSQQSSGSRAESPADKQPVRSQTPENRQGRIDPSAPTSGTEAGGSRKGAPLSDSFGEAGDPSGRGNLEVPEQTVNAEKNLPSGNPAGNNPTPDRPGVEGAGDLKRRKKDEDEAA